MEIWNRSRIQNFWQFELYFFSITNYFIIYKESEYKNLLHNVSVT